LKSMVVISELLLTSIFVSGLLEVSAISKGFKFLREDGYSKFQVAVGVRLLRLCPND
jgi:hypothetical protein